MGFGAFEIFGIFGIVLYTILPMIILVVLITVGVRWAVANALRDVARDEQTHMKIKGSARDILDRRYADGEIGREDYLKIKDDIERNTGNRDA